MTIDRSVARPRPTHARTRARVANDKTARAHSRARQRYQRYQRRSPGGPSENVTLTSCNVATTRPHARRRKSAQSPWRRPSLGVVSAAFRICFTVISSGPACPPARQSQGGSSPLPRDSGSPRPVRPGTVARRPLAPVYVQ